MKVPARTLGEHRTVDEELAEWAYFVALDPYYIGWTLRIYQRRRGLDDVALAEALEMPLRNLNHLRVCALPLPDSLSYRYELAHVAAVAGCNAFVLKGIIEETVLAQPTP